MIVYQLDKCTDSHGLCSQCVQEGLVHMHRFSSMGKSDETPDAEVLDHCLSEGRILLTSDGTFHTDNESRMLAPHLGVVIVNNATPKNLGITRIKSHLGNFKAKFPSWTQIIPRNSVVYITESWVEVWGTRNDKLQWLDRFDYSQPDWQDKLADHLSANGAIGVITNQQLPPP